MDQASAQQPTNISKEAVRGTFWVYMSFFFGKLLAFLSTIILTGVLGPENYGIMGYCLIAIQYLEVFNNLGMGTALISRRDRIKEAANAAFLISQAVGWVLFGLAWLGAPAIARFFEEPAVTDLFRVLTLTLPLSALGMVPNAMLHRNLRFKVKLIPDVSSTLVKGVVAITLAYLGYGVWSLVYAQIAAVVTAVVLTWALAGWRPSLNFDRQVSREMMTFGGHIVVVGLVGALQDNVDYLLVGKALGATALGYYTLAYRVPELIIRNFNYVVQKVAHPLLSQLDMGGSQLREVFFGYIRYIGLLTFPAGVGLALISPLFFRTFFGPEWAPAIVLMQLLALALAITSVGFVPGVLYKAINRPEILNYMALVRLPITIAALWYSTRWGITGVAAMQLGLGVFSVIIECIVVSRVVKFELDRIVHSLAPALACSMVMALVLGVATMLLPDRGVLNLVLLVALGIASYLGALMLVSRETVLQARSTLRGTFSRRSRPKPTS